MDRLFGNLLKSWICNESMVILLMCSHWFQFMYKKLEVGWHSNGYKSVWSAVLTGGVYVCIYPWDVNEPVWYISYLSDTDQKGKKIFWQLSYCTTSPLHGNNKMCLNEEVFVSYHACNTHLYVAWGTNYVTVKMEPAKPHCETRGYSNFKQVHKCRVRYNV